MEDDRIIALKNRVKSEECQLPKGVSIISGDNLLLGEDTLEVSVASTVDPGFLMALDLFVRGIGGSGRVPSRGSVSRKTHKHYDKQEWPVRAARRAA